MTKIYTVNSIDRIIANKIIDVKTVTKTSGGLSTEYFNIACAFDIETTSMMIDNVKYGFMYCWQVAIDDVVIMGRCWEEFIQMCKKLTDNLNLSTHRRLIFYIHNISFEFQFLRKHFDWYQIFAMETYKPIYAVTMGGIEFRCSYRLSNTKLANLDTSTKKLDNFDYSKIRHKLTRLSDEEIEYCAHDVLVVTEYINQEIKYCGDISKIPLTSTGYVRKKVADACMDIYKSKNDRDNMKYKKYKKLMNELTLTAHEYKQLKRAFTGGFTHSNPYYTRKLIIDSVTSYDFTSAYPSVMISEKFPMSKGVLHDRPSYNFYMKCKQHNCCLLDIVFTNLRSKIKQDFYISESKTESDYYSNVVSNGRIVKSKKCRLTVTDVDLDVIEQVYDYDDIEIVQMYTYRSAYLPKEIVMCVLDFYNDKTKLKGVVGSEDEYNRSKALLNSVYGMTVMDIVRETILYSLEDEWGKEKIDFNNIDNVIDKYNNGKRRFLFYPWGVWITAYTRRNLWSAILECGNDYIYADTDSVKILNADKHKKYFDEFNLNMISKLEKAMDHHKLNKDLIRPKTIEGVEKIIGIWDYEGYYVKFKTLGAKRYMVEKPNGKLILTASGLLKDKTIDYFIEEANKNDISPFDVFDNELHIPEDKTGKLTHTYIDEMMELDVTDYQGNSTHVIEKSGVHLGAQKYDLNMSDDFIDFINNLHLYLI